MYPYLLTQFSLFSLWITARVLSPTPSSLQRSFLSHYSSSTLQGGGVSSFLMFLSFSLAFMIKFQIFSWMWYLALIVSITRSPRKRISIGTCLNTLVCGHMWEDTVYHGWRHSLGRESCTRAEKSSWTQASQSELVCTLSFCSWLQVWCDWLLKFLVPWLFYELKPGLVTEMTSSPLSWLLSGYVIPTIDCS